MIKKLKVSTPGRICLFGEHQDYLGLPIIAGAISKRITISGIKRDDSKITINLPDINDKLLFEITEGNFVYTQKGDYFKSCVNVLKNNGFRFPHGFDCEITGNIPIKAGTSSSSAMIVSWINFLSKMSNAPKELSPAEIAQLAYEAEVLEFDEAGGMMDQFSTSVGDLIFLSSEPSLKIESLSAKLGTFVLGDSLQPKDTQGILSRVGNIQREAISEAKKIDQSFDIHKSKIEKIDSYKELVPPELFTVLKGTIRNRDITYTAKEILENGAIDDIEIGRLLTELHNILHKVMDISTPKIEKMIDAAIEAGALGAKINGSGGGGCMFAYAPQNPGVVAKAIEEAGGKSYIIRIDKGTRVDY